MSNEIPVMTHPLSKHWRQPPLESIAIDDTHALMTTATFNALSDYSLSIPSGVYEGKMWRRHDNLRTWLLMWYGPADDPDKCSINHRVILIADEPKVKRKQISKPAALAYIPH